MQSPLHELLGRSAKDVYLPRFSSATPLARPAYPGPRSVLQPELTTPLSARALRTSQKGRELLALLEVDTTLASPRPASDPRNLKL